MDEQEPSAPVSRTWWERLAPERRKRLLVLLFVPLLLLVGREVSVAWARDIPVEVRFGEPGVTELTLTYELDGEVVQHVAFAPPARARSVHHEAHLPPGRYEVVVVATRGGEEHRYLRHLDSPAEGRVILPIEEEDR